MGLLKWLKRRHGVPMVLPESDPALMVLRDLVSQIEGADYRDRRGNRLELNAAFRDARDLVDGYPARRSRKVRN
jgi:hypothetical protein